MSCALYVCSGCVVWCSQSDAPYKYRICGDADTNNNNNNTRHFDHTAHPQQKTNDADDAYDSYDVYDYDHSFGREPGAGRGPGEVETQSKH